MKGFLKKYRKCTGSVLMETVLVIPLFLAFFSGVCMLGELTYSRIRLSSADRYSVWLAGIRHEKKSDDEIKGDASNAFYPSGDFSTGTELKSFRSSLTASDWYAVVSGGAELKAVLPVWASGTRKGVIQILAGEDDGKPDANLWNDISFKAREINGEDTHSVLMRQEYDIRDKSGEKLAQGAPLWFVEYRTAYIDRKGNPNDKPSSLTVTSCSQYMRNSQYVGWSR